MKKFIFKELDQEGLDTLRTISKARKFNQWMFETIQPFIKAGRILEVGSGIGNISEFFLNNGYDICLSDVRENYCGYLQEKYKDHPQLIDIVRLDLVDPLFEQIYAPFLGSFDTVYALNVIEHIEDDVLALQNCKKLLRPGGRLIILVPAYQTLYNRFDENLYHFRRYTRSSMKEVFIKNQIPVLADFHFNFIGILGWVLSGSILRKEGIPSGQMKIYDRLVPVFRMIDKILLRKIGLSVVVVGEK